MTFMKIPRCRWTIVLLGLCAGLIGTHSILRQSVSVSDAADEKLHHIRKTYLVGLGQSQQELVRLVRQAADETNLSSSRELPSRFSLEGSIAAGIRATFLDQLTLWDSTCNKIAAASVQKPLPRSCPTPDSVGKLSWDFSGEAPMLLYSIAIVTATREKYVLTGTTLFDTNWMASLPSGLRYRQDFDLYFAKAVPRSATEILPLGPGIHLVSDVKWFFRWQALAFWLKRIAVAFDGTTEWFACILMVLVIAEEVRKSARQRRTLSHLSSWVEQTWTPARLGIEAETLQKKLHQHAKDDSLPRYSHVLRALADKHIGSLENKATALQKSLKDAQEDSVSDRERIATLERELEDLKLQSSTLQQCKSMAGKILLSWSHLREKMNGLQTQWLPYIRLRAETLQQWSMAWQREIGSLGTRKFIRSMTEVEGELSGRSKLDEQLQHVQQLTQENAEAAAALRLSFNEVLRDSARLNFLLTDWHLTSQNNWETQEVAPSSSDSSSLWSTGWSELEDSLSLLLPHCRLIGSAGAQVSTGETNASKEASETSLPLPMAVFKPALLHLVRGLAHLFSESHKASKPVKNELGLRYLVRPTATHQRIILTMDRLNPTATLAKEMEKDSANIIDQIMLATFAESEPDGEGDLLIAQRLFTRFNISLHQLPSVSSAMSLMLNWKRQDELALASGPTLKFDTATEIL